MIPKTVVLRKETKNQWERRTALSPKSVKELISAGLDLTVEESSIRIYPNSDYQKTGAKMVTTTDDANVVVGIKEPPIDTVKPGQTHLCFSHTIKGQPYNMPLLKAFIERGATLIDYEPMLTDDNKRIAAVFSQFAGMSGTIETLIVAAKKIALQGNVASFANLKQPWEYGRLEEARAALRAIAPLKDRIRFLIVGNGNVGQGCISILECLGVKRIDPKELDKAEALWGPWYCVVDAADCVRAKNGQPFTMESYMKEGSKLYESTFERFLGKFDILLQGAYWDERFPRELPLSLIKERSKDLPFVIGDISCDIDGTIECTTQATSIDEPAFTFNTTTMQSEPGISVNGPTIMSIDNLPCELAADASDQFSELLSKCIPFVAEMDTTKPLKQSGLTNELQRGTIVYNGKLTAPFEYMQRFIEDKQSAVG